MLYLVRFVFKDFNSGDLMFVYYCFYLFFFFCFFVLAWFELILLIFEDFLADFLFIWFVLFLCLRGLGWIELRLLSMQSNYRFTCLLPQTELNLIYCIGFFSKIYITCLQKNEVRAIWFCYSSWFELNRNE